MSAWPTQPARGALPGPWLAAVLTAGLLLAAPLSARAQSSAEVFQTAEDLYAAGNWQQAYEAFEDFQKKFQYSMLAPNALYFQGWCRFSLGEFKEALAKFEVVLTKFPDSTVAPEAKLKIAECWRELEDYDKSLAVYGEFQRQYATSPFMPQSFLGQAWVLYKKKDLEGALRLAQGVRNRFAQQVGPRLDALFLIAQILNDQGKFEESRLVYDEIRGMRFNPRATEALFLAGEAMYNAGNKLLEEGKTEQAHKQLGDAIENYRKVQSRDSLLANIDRQVQDLQRRRRIEHQNRLVIDNAIESLRQLRASVDGRPDLRPSALFRVANSYQSLQKPEEASVVYRHFLRLYGDDPLAPQAQFGLIQSLTARGQAEQAKIETDRLEAQFPELKDKDIAAYAQFMRGQSEFNTGQFNDSITTFRGFLTTNKDASLAEAASFYIAAAYYSLRDWENAQKELKAFIEAHPQSKSLPDVKFRLGRSYFEVSQATEDPAAREAALQSSVAAYEEVRTSGKDELMPEVTFQLGYLYSYLSEYDTNQFARAATLFAEFSSKWPDNELAPEALYQLARNRFAAGNQTGAVEAYQALVAKFPDNRLAPFAAYETAVVHGSGNRPDEMIAALRTFIELYPDNEKTGDAYYAIGQDLENRREFDKALVEYQNLVKFAAAAQDANEGLVNSAIAAQLQIAKMLEGRQTAAAAVQSCEEFLKQFNQQPAAARAMVAQIAGILSRAKLFKEAYDKLNALATEYIRSDPVRIAAYTSLIELALSQGDTQTAFAAALRLQADPARDSLPAASYFAIGNALARSGRAAEALEAYETLVSKFPDDPRNTPQGLVAIGKSCLELQRLDRAEEAFGLVIVNYADNPISLEAKIGMGRILETKGRDNEAVPLYDEALRLGRGDVPLEASYRLGMLAHKRQDYKSALAFFARLLLASGPMAEEAAFRSAQCHRELGSVPLARRTYQSFLARYPQSRFAPQARQELDALPPPQP